MHQHFKTTVIAAVAISAAEAFVTNPAARAQLPATRAASLITPSNIIPSSASVFQLYGTEDDNAQDNEIERLKKMAAKLRAEAAALEADKANQLALAAEKAFRKFDINLDGEVSLSELKAGLEKELKVCRLIDELICDLRTEQYTNLQKLSPAFQFRLKYQNRE